MMHHIVPEYTEGQSCDCCGFPAAHKVEEVIEDDTIHPYTAYVCCECFGNTMGVVARESCDNARADDVMYQAGMIVKTLKNVENMEYINDSARWSAIAHVYRRYHWDYMADKCDKLANMIKASEL